MYESNELLAFAFDTEHNETRINVRIHIGINNTK
jgi:hypothetical protein